MDLIDRRQSENEELLGRLSNLEDKTHELEVYKSMGGAKE